MVGKLITFGGTRDKAIAKMLRALDEIVVTGVKTTIPFHNYVFDHPVFRSGNFNTGFVEEYFSDKIVNEKLKGAALDAEARDVAMAAALQYYLDRTALISSNHEQEEEAALRWKLVHRLNSTSFLPG